MKIYLLYSRQRHHRLFVKNRIESIKVGIREDDDAAAAATHINRTSSRLDIMIESKN